MALPRTLWWYIAKEMGKVFLLTSAGMTVVLGLGGGVFNIVEIGEATTSQLIRILMLMIPMMAALTLPIAALYSATATYGRLSADNEFVACRSSGINIHSLFMPAALLSLLSALVTFVFINFVVPGMFKNLAAVVTPDLGRFLVQRISRPKGLPVGDGVRIKADRARVDASNPNRVVVERVALGNLRDDEWVFYGTSREVIIQFTEENGRPELSAVAHDVRGYDRGAYFEFSESNLGTQLPEQLLLDLKLKFLDLFELIQYWRAPGTWRESVAELEKLRQAIGGTEILDAVWVDWREDGVVVFDDGKVRYEVRSQAEGGRSPRDGMIEIADATVHEHRPSTQDSRVVRAERVRIEFDRADSLEEAALILEAHGASFSDGVRTVHKDVERMGPLPMPADVVERVSAMSADALLAAPAAKGEPAVVGEHRDRAIAVRDEVRREIAGIIHERITYSVSVLGLVLLGAALGIVFRGAHMVTAFGISFVPLLFVIIAIVAGKQLANNAGSHAAGLLVMWSGIGVVGLLDVWALGKLVRR